MEQGFNDSVKLALYRHVAETGSVPNATATAELVGSSSGAVREAFARLRAKRVLLLEPDGETIRMAPPFSGVPTQHRVVVDGRGYFANCAWDALGVVAALRRPGTVHSECAQSHEPLELAVGAEGPPASDWVFHCLVPAAHWWDDLVFT